MQITVSISPTVVASNEGAAISLTSPDGLQSALYLDFTELLRSVREPSKSAQDFLLVAATVYALDKLVSRSKATDRWTRNFDVTIPVVDPETWNRQSSVANECLSFLSGDVWSLQFTPRNSPLIRRKRRKRRAHIRPRFATGTTTCLFSGGLDSLIGAINWLESHPDEALTLVGHHDPGIGGPLSDQEKLFRAIEKTYKGRLSPVFVGGRLEWGRSKNEFWMCLYAPGKPYYAPRFCE